LKVENQTPTPNLTNPNSPSQNLGALRFSTNEGDVIHNVTTVNIPGFPPMVESTDGDPENTTLVAQINCSELSSPEKANSFWLASYMRDFYDAICTSVAERGGNASELCRELVNGQNITVPACADPSAPCTTIVRELVKADSAQACETAGASLPADGSGSGVGTQPIGIAGVRTRFPARNSTPSCDIVNGSVAGNTTCFFFAKEKMLEYIPAPAASTSLASPKR
jgi:hypothetical protein